jgi:hypothetical protein
VLTDDYLAVPEDEIKQIESVLTVVGGKIVHATEEFSSHAPPVLPVMPEWSPVKVFGGYGAPLDLAKAARAGVPVSNISTTPPATTMAAHTPRTSSWLGSRQPANALPASGVQVAIASRSKNTSG